MLWLPQELWDIIFGFVLDGNSEFALDNFRYTMRIFDFDGVKVPFSKYSDVIVSGNRDFVRPSAYSILNWMSNDVTSMFRIDVNYITRLALTSKFQRKDAALWFPLELVHPKAVVIILERMDWRLVRKFIARMFGWKYNFVNNTNNKVDENTKLIEYANKVAAKNKIILPKRNRVMSSLYEFFSYENITYHVAPVTPIKSDNVNN